MEINSNTFMDVNENRRKNAQTLLEAMAGNDQGLFAEKIKRDRSYVSRIAGPNAKKPIGSKIARVIEKAFKLEELWLDQEHSDIELEALSDRSMDVLISAVLNYGNDVDFNLLKEVTAAITKLVQKKKNKVSKKTLYSIIHQYYDECEYHNTQPTLKRAQQIVDLFVK